MRIRRMTVWTIPICLAAALVLEAQPGGRRGGMSGGMGGVVAPEQLFSLLAFEERFNVTDKQLLALRAALKPVYVERREMMAEIRRGEHDSQAMRQEIRPRQREMRDRMMGALATALDARQMDRLRPILQQDRRGGPPPP